MSVLLPMYVCMHVCMYDCMHACMHDIKLTVQVDGQPIVCTQINFFRHYYSRNIKLDFTH